LVNLFSTTLAVGLRKGLISISLDVDAAPDKLRAEAEVALNKLRAEFEAKGVSKGRMSRTAIGDTRSWLFAISTAVSSTFPIRAMRKRKTGSRAAALRGRFRAALSLT
jgi:hypothetical protein